MAKVKITDKNTQASKKYLEEHERISELEKQFTRKQAEAEQKLEKLEQKKSELDAAYVSELDPVKLERLAKDRRELQYAIENEKMLTSLSVPGEISKHLQSIKQLNNEASKEFAAFKAEANAELVELKKKFEADQAEINALFGAHPYAKAYKLNASLLERTRAR